MAKLKHLQSFGLSKVPLHRIVRRRSPLRTKLSPLLRRRRRRSSSPRRKRGLPLWCQRRPKPRKSPPCLLPQLRQLSRRRLRPLFPRRRGEARQTPKASFPPAAGEARQSEVDRAPSLAAEAPASRVGSVMNDADGNPLFCLVQLWACRKRCESCENAFCQATFADRTSAYHARHRCRDCKRAEGRAAAHQQSSWPSQSWESLGANPGVRIGERIGASLALKVRHPLGARLSPVLPLRADKA